MDWETFRHNLQQQIKMREDTFHRCDMANVDWAESKEGLAEQAEINVLRAVLYSVEAVPAVEGGGK